jgi:hypothetical protein
MNLPKRLTIRDDAIAMDGGSVALICTDDRGKMTEIVLAQHMVIDADSSADYVPGRLHLDGEPVPVRSDAEARLIALLRRADVRYAPWPDRIANNGLSSTGPPDAKAEAEAEMRELLAEVIGVVESPEYVDRAAEVDCRFGRG